MTYHLPPSVARIVAQRVGACKNLGLLLDKYVPEQVIGHNKEKGEWLRGMPLKQHIDAELARHAYQRWLALTTAYRAAHFRALLDWRMVVGLGGETVLETDLTLHHLYGIPYIPGSALKGLTRAYVTGEEQPSTEEEKDSEEVKRIFGSQKRAGSVCFFDALPLDGQAAFAIDIMNPHYPDYYKSLKSTMIASPTNDQQPNPIPFLTVERTEFAFALAPRRSQDEQHQRDVEQVKAWLQNALKDYGIGGKTSAGYGYFKDAYDLASSASLSAPAATTTNAGSSSSQSNAQNASQAPADPELKRVEGHLRELAVLKDVAGQINGYYQQWRQLTSEDARLQLAKAIVEKVRQAGREKATVEKPWYKELLAFLEQTR